MVYDFRKRSDDARLFFEEPSLAKQSFASSCDIQTIMKRYKKSGVNPHCILPTAKFGDFTSIPDYRESLSVIAEANEAFASLPAKMRKRFSNDPHEFFEFCHDPENRSEAIKLGLISPTIQEGIKGEGEPLKEATPA